MLDFTAMEFHSKFICINIGGKKKKDAKKSANREDLSPYILS